jgi:hypothetical protein
MGIRNHLNQEIIMAFRFNATDRARTFSQHRLSDAMLISLSDILSRFAINRLQRHFIHAKANTHFAIVNILTEPPH